MRGIRKPLCLFLVAALVLVIPDGHRVKAKTSSMKITNTQNRLRLQKGKTFKLKTNMKAKFSSSNRRVARVNSQGVLKGLRVGTAKITAASRVNPKKKATISVSVTKDILVSGIRLNRTKIAADEFNEKKIRLSVRTILPSKAKNKRVEWFSSDAYTADVDENGMVTTGNAGTATIIARAADQGGAYATCRVTVTEKEVMEQPATPAKEANPTPSGKTGEAAASTPGHATELPSVTTSPIADQTPRPTQTPALMETPRPTPTSTWKAAPTQTPDSDEQVKYVRLTNDNVFYKVGLEDEDGNRYSNQLAIELADGSIMWDTSARYSGGGMSFYLNDDRTPFDLSRYSKIVITASSPQDNTDMMMSVQADEMGEWSAPRDFAGSIRYSCMYEANRQYRFVIDLDQVIADPANEGLDAYGIYVKYNGYHKPSEDATEEEKSALKKTVTIHSIALIGRDKEEPGGMPTQTPTEEPGGTPTLIPTARPTKKPENFRNPDEVAALKELIAGQRALGATVSEDLDSEEYVWDGKGNLVEIRWGVIERIDPATGDMYRTSKHLSGSISFASFPALRILDCEYSQLSGLDVSGNPVLEQLTCKSNQLSSLDVSGNTDLMILECGGNQVSSLDVSGCADLRRIDCDGNQLKNLDVSGNPVLEWLNCGRNQLGSLDVSNNPALGYLYCYDNQLDSLDVSGNLGLDSLWCGGNPLRSLDLSNNLSLQELSCSQSKLKSLDVSALVHLRDLTCRYNSLESLNVSGNLELESLWCGDNRLSSLDVSGNPVLKSLECSNNQLSSLDLSGNPALDWVSCSYNQITSLDLSGNPVLKELHCSYGWLRNLNVSGNSALEVLDCSNSQLSSLDVSGNPNLKTLYCSSNLLTSLDVSGNPALENLGFSKNQLGALDVSTNLALKYLNCSQNPIEGLDVSENRSLEGLYCVGNRLTSLDVSQNPALQSLNCSQNQLTSLDVSRNAALERLICESNQLSSLDLSANKNLTELSCDPTVTVTGYQK